MKRVSLLLAAVLILGLFAACGSSAPEAQDYTLACGGTLTAENGLTETEQAPFTTTLMGKNTMVTFLDENKQLLAQGISLEEYAAIVVSGNGLENDFALDSNGNLATTYTRQVEENTFFYYAAVYETDSSFWLVQMTCLEDQKDVYEPLFSQWLATVELPVTELAAQEIVETTYELDCGMTVTLPEGMGETLMEGWTVFLHNNLLGFTLLEEEKSEGWTLDDYAAALSQAYGLDAMEENEFGVPTIAYSEEVNGMVYYYYITVHETADAFWLCQMYCPESAIEQYGDHIPAWSASLAAAE